jgi:purine-binding chemotaxis protein CheW
VSAEDRSAATVAELRRAFDDGFERAPAAAAGMEALLALRAGDDALAVRLHETRGLERWRSVLPLPAVRPELLGLCGLRGQLVPVFDLAALLGGALATAPRWLILCGASETIALAVAHFDGHRAAAAADFLADAHTGRRYVPYQVRVDGTRRGLLDLRSIVQDIDMRAAAEAAKER